MGSLRVVLITLLLIQTFVTAAGAIYIEGADNTMPADGSPVILSATAPADGMAMRPIRTMQSFTFPVLAMPGYDDMIGDMAIGHMVSPAPIGFWDNIIDFKTNMPTIDRMRLLM